MWGCWLLCYKYSHFSRFQVTNVMTPNTELGRDVHTGISQVYRSLVPGQCSLYVQFPPRYLVNSRWSINKYLINEWRWRDQCWSFQHNWESKSMCTCHWWGNTASIYVGSTFWVLYSYPALKNKQLTSNCINICRVIKNSYVLLNWYNSAILTQPHTCTLIGVYNFKAETVHILTCLSELVSEVG